MKKTPVTVRFVEKRLLEILGLLLLALPLVYFLFLYHQGQALLSPAAAIQPKDCPGCQKVQMTSGDTVWKRAHPQASGVLMMVQGFKQPVSQMTKYLRYAKAHQLSILLLDLNATDSESGALPPGWGWGCLERDRVAAFLRWAPSQFPSLPLGVLGTGLAHHSLRHLPWPDAVRLAVLDEPVPGLKNLIQSQVARQQLPRFVGSHFYSVLAWNSEPDFQGCLGTGPPNQVPLWVFYTPEPLVEAEARLLRKTWAGEPVETHRLKDAKLTSEAETALTPFIQKALRL